VNDRRALLTAALGFLQLPAQTSALRAPHTWLDSWTGIGHIVVGMDRHGFRLSLEKWGNSDGGWTAAFERDAKVSPAGFGSAATPWQRYNRPRGAPFAAADNSPPGRHGGLLPRLNHNGSEGSGWSDRRCQHAAPSERPPRASHRRRRSFSVKPELVRCADLRQAMIRAGWFN
jgi:hypothetical protein